MLTMFSHLEPQIEGMPYTYTAQSVYITVWVGLHDVRVLNKPGSDYRPRIWW
jgi:hypothetical protein